MKLSAHADRTEKIVGIRAEDIHQWIDGFFDRESFEAFLADGQADRFNPYNHRKYRHCREALEGACRQFEGLYTREQIQAVFECHLRDDYDGFVPLQEDFESSAFARRYHEEESPGELEKILSEAELSAYFKGRPYGPRGRNRPPLSPRFYWRIVWPTVIAAVIFAVAALAVVVPLFRGSMLKQKKQMIRELASTAAGTVEFYLRQEKAGILPREDAQRKAARAVSVLRYGVDRKDYFWITDMQPRMVMHPYRPELEGVDLANFVDREDQLGKRLFVELVELVRKDGEGYLEYQWQWMDDESRREPKLSYVRSVPEWDWVLGTGVYLNDVEEEIGRLQRNLLAVDGLLAFIILAILVNLVLQSRRIEVDRQLAESGLREAKDRYRALVEGAREGYLLEMEGETVYANHTLQRLTGFSEKELVAKKAWELLTQGSEDGMAEVGYLQRLYREPVASAEFNARIRTSNGQLKDVCVKTSRIFFSDTNGHVISFSEISRGREDTLEAYFGQPVQGPGSQEGPLPQRIAGCNTGGQVIELLRELPALTREMSERGVRVDILRDAIGSAYDAALRRFIELALDEAGEMPAAFAYVSLGSNARHEMTLFSDQDNMLIFEDVDPGQLAEVRRTFLRLADRVCGQLKQAGFPYCPGGIMAANPQWCLSLSEWKDRFGGWMQEATPQTILEVNVFFDVHCAYGEDGLVRRLQSRVEELAEGYPAFFLHYAQNGLLYKAPVGLRGRIRAVKKGSRRMLNLKECIKPIEVFARIYGLKYKIHEPGTLERLRKLRDMGVLQASTFRDTEYIFNYLWRLRFLNQLSAHIELSASPDDLDLDQLSEIEQEHLQAVLNGIPVLHSKLSYDFLGTA